MSPQSVSLTPVPPWRPSSWPAYLDALEEWSRRADAAVRGGDDPLRPLDPPPEGAVPQEHALRARILLARLRSLEDVGARRAAELDRARAYDPS